MSPPVILLDMDGVVVDWDAGFYKAYGRGADQIVRSSYYMEACVPAEHRDRAIELFHSKDFFLNLPPMRGSLDAVRTFLFMQAVPQPVRAGVACARQVRAMAARGYKVLFCTSPVLTSAHCASEKYGWIIKHFGQGWASSVVMTADKTTVPPPAISADLRRDLARTSRAISRDLAGARRHPDRRQAEYHRLDDANVAAGARPPCTRLACIRACTPHA